MLIGIDASRAVTQQRTGTEAYALHLLQELIILTADSDHKLRLYFNQAPSKTLFPNLPHVEQCVIPLPRLWTQVRLVRELRAHTPDIFFTPSHVIPFTYRDKSVVTIHDLGFHHFPAAHTKSQLAYLKLSTRLNGRAASRLVADSQATKADLIRYYKISPTKIDVIYPGIDPALARVTDPAKMDAIQYKYGIESPYLITIGTLQPRKNLVRLVKAFSAAELPHQLVLAGKVGWNSDPIIDEIGKLNTRQRERILLPGFIAEEDKAVLISGAEALLFPSLYEGFGFPLLEGQICATPVLASNTSSLPEIAGDGALLVDPHSSADLTLAIQRIVEDNLLRSKLIENGLLNVQRFNWRKTAESVLQTLEKTYYE